MLRLKRAASLAAIRVAAACTADAISPTAPEVPDARLVISDAAHAGPTPGFYFLWPMVPPPGASGVFDGTLAPRVEICQLSGSVCGPVIKTYTSGAGLAGILVDPILKAYFVFWPTQPQHLDPAKFYRVSVFVDSVRLGYADLDVVRYASQLGSVNQSQYVPVLKDAILPIRFRIERGIVRGVTVTPANDSVNVGATKQFTATCTDLHNAAIACPATTWSSSSPAVATINATGLATGVAAGTTTITASIGYRSGSTSLKVVQPNTPPVANADAFDAIGNVTIPVAAPGVLANDTDTETPSGLSVVPGTVATANGGTATLAANGSFTYLTPAGFTGSDTFTYTVTDGSLTATGTVTMTSATRVWYVSNAGAGPGDGRDASPFTTLAAAEGPSTVGETIFLLYGNGTPAGYDAGFTFKAGQSLTGQGVPANVTAVVNGGTIVLLQAGSAPTVTNASAGATLRLATGNTAQGMNVNSTAGAGVSGSGFGTFTASSIQVAATGGPSLDLQNGTVAASFASLSSSNSAGAGLRLVGVAGSLAAPAGIVANAAGNGVDVSGGDANVSYGGSISGSGTHAASVTGRTGGTLTLSGNITDAAGGILAQNNSGGTIAFNGSSKSLSTGAATAVTLASNAGATVSFGGGGLNIATTGANGFTAAGGGTLNVTGANNVIATAGGTALSVVNTSIGASGLSFRSISAAGGANGIVLDNTGAVNGLQVTGTGAAGSGGTIQNVTGADGSTAGTGVYLDGARSVSLSWMQIGGASNFAIRGVNVQGFALANSVVNGVNGDNAGLHEGSVAFDGLTGSASVTGTSVAGGVEDNFRVANSAGVLDRITFSGATFGANATATGRDALSLAASGGAVINATVQNSAFTSARVGQFHLALSGGAVSDLVFQNNTVSNAHPAIVSGAGGIEIVGTGAGTVLTYLLDGNSVRDALGTAIAVSKGVSAGPFSGTISSNQVGVASVPNSGSAGGSAIDVRTVDGGVHTTQITGNQLRQYNNFGISLTAGTASPGGSGTLNATVTGNTVSDPGTSGFPMNGLLLNAGTNTGDAHQVCLAASGNTLTGSGAFGGTDIRLRQRMVTTVRLPGYAGANNDNAAVQAFLQANNGVTPTAAAANTVSTGGGGFVGGAGCPLP